MAIQVIRKEFSSSSVESISSVNQMEVGVTLDNALITSAAGNATFLDSSYAVHDKGDVSAVVVYSDAGSTSLRAKEFYDARSFYGSTAFGVSGNYIGTYGEPLSSGAAQSFVSRINRWLEVRQLGTGTSNLTIKKVNFAVDTTGQKRALIVYNTASQTNTRYYAKIYSQVSAFANNGDGPLVQYDSDVQAIQDSIALKATEQFVAIAIDSSGRRHVLAIYAVTA
jgi:hypothetical protein